MGSSSSKFRKHLQNGDEYAAVHLYNTSSDLRKGLDPNSSYGDTYSHDTPLHFAARHAMKSLLRIFLYELGGNPNKKNSRNETSLHCVCMSQNAQTFTQQQRRYDCLQLILQWRGATLQDGEIEKVDLEAQDELSNTALHYASSSGLRRCVELLVLRDAPMFVENAQKQTPCDCAEKSGNNSIALYLESKMVFSNEEDHEDEDDLILDQIEAEEVTSKFAYSGLRAQDLQEAKDQLLVETSDMLRVPLFTAEALLRNHEWSRETLLEAWMEDPIACCESCGVVPPASALDGDGGVPHSASDHDLRSPTQTTANTEDTICDICACAISEDEAPVPMSCDHQFCRSCWERYLSGKIKEGEAHNITCPGFDCMKLVPVEIIETLVSKDMSKRYLQFDIKQFVDSNPNIKWCPYPGCGRAVRLPDSDNPLSPTFRDPTGFNAQNDFSHAVDCGNGHIFCWECLGEAHEPASCKNWKLWHGKTAEVKPEELSGTEEESIMAANCLWLVTNSKSCPNCKSPIQKNEGCNHMKCSKCKHDFCWVCLEPWKKHSSATGGYFRCNRYEVVKKVEEGTEKQKAEAEARNKRMQELNKFIHYYSRFKNHENSYKLEEPLLNTAKEKMMVLAKAMTDPDNANLETKFVEDAVLQLLKSRRVLKCSYVYGYYLEETGYKKPIFEFMQTELEECTETLSEMVARPYLRTPRHKIIQTAHLVQRKRHELVSAIAKGLVPADTSPNMKKKRKKFSVELDDDLKKALLASLQDLNPQSSWVKDPSGRHTNLAAVLDWPDSEDSDAEPPEPPADAADTADAADPEADEPPPAISLCVRKGCDRPRAQNPRTGEYHDHCSLKCMKQDQEEDEEEAVSPSDYFSDHQLELLRALEMSRLQFLREMGSLKPGSGDRSPRSPSTQPQTPQPSTSHLGAVAAGNDTLPSLPSTPIPVGQLVLQDPPRGKGRKSPQPEDPAGHRRSGSDFDPELQRALELSRLALQDEERQIRMAIEMSLQNSPNPSALGEDSTSLGTGELLASAAAEGVVNPFSCAEEYSTVVTRVPNKSVEDVSREVMNSERNSSGSSLADPMGACGGLPDLNNQRLSYGSHDFQHGGVGGSASSLGGRAKQSQFGVIKDLSANNLFTTDSNKTKDFEKKDFSQIYVKSGAPDMSAMEEKVFEPRPPYPPDEEYSLARKLHLGLSGSEDEDENGHEQVWKERKPSTSSVDRSFSGSPGIAHSPRENHTRFPMDHALSTLPDIIDTHLDRHRHAPSLNMRNITTTTTSAALSSSTGAAQSTGAYYQGSDHHLVSAFDEDDPGPHLDAVLRSLSKLTARLGDQDDFFLGSLSSDMPPPPSPPPPPLDPLDGSDHTGPSASKQCHSNSIDSNGSRPFEGQEDTDEQFFDADSSVHRQPTPPPPPPPPPPLLVSDLDDLEAEGQGQISGQGHQEEDQEAAVYV